MTEQLAIIGNCSTNALVVGGEITWLCWPRPDSSFVFGSLLDRDKGGAFSIEAVNGTVTEQAYLDSTNVLRTRFTAEGGSFEVIDFAPRFEQWGRYYRPTAIYRIVRHLSGAPLIRIRCEPVYDYGAKRATSWLASNHIEFQGLPAPLRLTTNAPLTHVAEGRPFVLLRDLHLALTWGQGLEEQLEETAERFLQRTVAYWRGWIKQTRVPRDYQREVIRSALVLKLHQYEDTGALLAATTTSLPEYPGSGRTWDYRYCWLRDAYFTLDAFEEIGHHEEVEKFLGFLRGLCARHGTVLRPVYTITGDIEMEERILTDIGGYRGDGPVRVGNQAHHHVQNDVYGELILAMSRSLLDVRMRGTPALDGTLDLVTQLLARISATLTEPDAGPWELRGIRQVHGFTLLTHWAGARMAAEIGRDLGVPSLVEQGEAIAGAARHQLDAHCWNAEVGAYTQAVGKSNLDASMLLALRLGLIEPDDPRARSHVEAIASTLRIGKHLIRRYDTIDDFGETHAAFTVVSFWLAEALHMVGRVDDARELFDYLLKRHNGLGLFAEDILVESGQQSGNFPQTYSHVGLINTAFRLSRRWD